MVTSSKLYVFIFRQKNLKKAKKQPSRMMTPLNKYIDQKLIKLY